MERELLHQRLADATNRLQWNYSIFWSFNPDQQVLVWGEGCVNGAESTELSLRRSQQLREVFIAMDTITGQPSSQASAQGRHHAALSQLQGLTPTEWFFMCSMACSFASGAGLPGRAYGERRYVWHCITSEDDTRAVVRARLAQRARIQTIVCIPALDGVVEFGTTTLVEETTPLLQQMQSVFSARTTTRDMSAFKWWSTRGPAPHRQQDILGQRMLKAALLAVPRLYAVDETVHVVELGEVQAASERLRGSQCSRHVDAERRRREKLKNGFGTLRSLVPSATKSNRVLLLGDAIKYVRALQSRVEELESNRKRKQVEVTMENNNIAAVKITCISKDSLFIHILQTMVALHLEVVEATANVSDGLLTATLKAKVTSPDELDNDEKRDKIQAELLNTIEEKLTDTAHEP